MNTNPEAQQAVDVATVTLNPAIDQTVIVPDFAAGKVNRVQQSESHPGGKGVNVAHILSDYGRSVVVSGFLGRENAGLFEDLFAAKRMQDCFVRIAGQTRVGIKIVDPVQQQTTDINFPGQPPAPADVDALFDCLEMVDAAWFVLAGSIPPGVEPTIYRDLVRALKMQERQVALDASGEALVQALAAGPDVVKPNIYELESVVGERLRARPAIVAAARSLLGRGIRLVAVSMGSEGSIFVSERGVVVARPPSVEVKSTVGAGDAMVAGIVAAQIAGAPLEHCASLATAFSLDAISHIGSGLSSVASVETFMERVTVSEDWR